MMTREDLIKLGDKFKSLNDEFFDYESGVVCLDIGLNDCPSISVKKDLFDSIVQDGDDVSVNDDDGNIYRHFRVGNIRIANYERCKS